MKRRFFPFLVTMCGLVSACTAPTVTPTPIPASAAPAPTAQATQPTANPPTAAMPTLAPTVVATAMPSDTPIQATAEATVVPTIVAPPLERTLSLQQPALQGEDVLVLQQRLLELGYSQLGQADGVFGLNTEKAVRAFQTLNRIEVDGVVGSNTWFFLYTADAVGYDLHPIVDTQRDFLLGAANGTGWVETLVAAELLGETTYQLPNQSGDVATATGMAPAPIEGPPCDDTRLVKFDPPVAAERPIALEADWNTLPRPVTEVPTDTAALQAPVATALRVLGIAEPQVRISRALRADLDNNNSEETIIAATYRASGHSSPLPSADTGDYSVLLVLPNNATVASVIAADAITNDIEFGAPLEFQLLGLWDVNGDGMLEIAATADYYEGESTGIYTLRGTATKQVLNAGCGV